MFTLRLHPFSLHNVDYQKREKRIKRVEALALSMPEDRKKLYYADNYRSLAEDFAKIIGNTDLRPLEEISSYPKEEYRIIVDGPEKLSRDLYNKTGVNIDFNKSMAVLSEVDNMGKEFILWSYKAKDWIFFAYPEEIMVPSRQETGISLQELMLPKIEEGFKKILKNLDNYIENPSEIESVHQYRVSIRSFRALISLVKPILSPSFYTQIQDIFRQKGRDAELLRELDVLTQQWDKVRDTEELALRNALVAERKKEEERLLEVLKDNKTVEELKNGLNLFINSLSITDWHNIDGIYLMDERLHNWYRFTLESLWQMEGFNFPYVHRIRLKSKKYRYISEFFSEHITQSQLKHHKDAKKRQGVLGDVCDALRNQEAVKELAVNLKGEALVEAEKFIDKEKARENQLLSDLGFVDTSEDFTVNNKKEIVENNKEQARAEALDEVVEKDETQVDIRNKRENLDENTKKDKPSSLISVFIGIVVLFLIYYFMFR
ncbi:putative membrane protein [Peptoniphilus sp. ING2-D1G]|nr:putative membrane protein [Peptoniphilus sp. ING2-D1G]